MSSVDLDTVRRRHADYEQAWADPPEQRPSATWMTMAACTSAGDVPALVTALDALAPLLDRLRQIRQTWPSLVDMEPGDAWREIQEIMALVPQEEQ